MKIRFIINPISGTGKQKGIEKLISKHFNEYDVFYTKKTGDAKKFSKNSVKNNFDAVVSVGGDGTLNECSSSLVNTNTALGVIPCGSGNGFAFHIGMNKHIETSLKQIKNSYIKEIDTCYINKNIFINVSGIGFDAHIAKLFSNLKTRGFINYIKLILKELKYKPKKYNLKYNKIDRSIKAYMISFANASQYGNNAKISPNAIIDDGNIDFVIVKDFPKWHIPNFLYKVMNGTIDKSNYVEIIREKKMIITTKDTLIHLDGESKNATKKIKIEIIPKSLKILLPNEKK